MNEKRDFGLELLDVEDSQADEQGARLSPKLSDDPGAPSRTVSSDARAQVPPVPAAAWTAK